MVERHAARMVPVTHCHCCSRITKTKTVYNINSDTAVTHKLAMSGDGSKAHWR